MLNKTKISFDENDEIYNYIDKLLSFLNNVLNEYNIKIIKRKRQIDFYDLFVIF